MGFALPAAIGAKFACPEAEVWAIVGDGGFQMTQAELATIKQEQIKVNVAIINNGYLGMVRQWQEFFYVHSLNMEIKKNIAIDIFYLLNLMLVIYILGC